MTKVFSATAAVLVSFLVMTQAAAAAELRLISAQGPREVLKELMPKFERATGNTVTMLFTETGEIRTRIAAGENFDVIIVPSATTDEFIKQAKIAGTATPVARTSFGMAVRVDGPKPDTSSAEAFKRSLLAAPTIIITDPATGGISGVHFASVLEKLGIATEMKPKLKLLRGGSYHAQMVAKGEGDLAVQAEHEIRCVPGIAFLPYPTEFQRTIVFTAGVGAGAKDAAAARALIQYVSGPDAATALAAHCMRAG